MPGTPPPISDFLTATTLHSAVLCCFERTRGRGSMQRIDAVLQPYLLYADDCPVQERVNALARIITECRRWLNNKGTGTKNTTTSRKPHVETLLREATVWYKYYHYEDKKAEATTAGANAHQVDGNTKNAVRPTTPLFAGYQNETSRAKNLPRPAASIVKGYVAQAVSSGDIQHTSLNTLTPQEYAFVEQLAETDSPTPTMAYLSKLSRLGTMVLVEDGKLMVDPVTPYHTGTRMHAYAVDRYGNIYAKVNSDGYFHHSSFCRGQEVICAGCLLVDNGVLTNFNNLSGHYLPSRANLHNAVQLLHEYDLDLSRASAWVLEPAPQGTVCGSHGNNCHNPVLKTSIYNQLETFRLNPAAAASSVTCACSG